MADEVKRGSYTLTQRMHDEHGHSEPFGFCWEGACRVWREGEAEVRTFAYVRDSSGVSWSPHATGDVLKFMPPGHFCPDVCGIEDFGEADHWRGRVVRAFFTLMRAWPKPRPTNKRGT